MNILNIEQLKTQRKILPNSFVFADCLDAMSFIKDKSIDMILCDPPFQQTNAAWDKIIDLEKMWIQYKRIIKDNGAILIFAQTPFDKILGCSNLEWLRYEWIWEKTHATGFFNCKKAPMKAHENILVFYKKPPKYFPQKTIGHKPVNKFTKKIEIGNKTDVYNKSNIDINGGGNTDRYPRDILKFSSDKQREKLTGTMHSAQKPLALIEYFIKTYTEEGDAILDNAAGSMTTAIAAQNLNRKFIMIENNEEIFQKGLKRIEMLTKIL